MKNNKRYRFTRLARLALWILFICTTLNASAAEEPYLNELKGANVAAGNFFMVSDEKFNNPTAWSQISNTISVDNIISFEINFDTSVYFYDQPFNCALHFKIYIYGNAADTSEITDSVTYADIGLEVRYDTVTGKPYKGIALYKFKGVHKYKVKIISITSPQFGASIPAIFRLKGQIIVNRKYIFIDNSTDVTRYSVVNGNQLKLQWTPSNYPGAEMFDLEYTHIDGHSQMAASITGYESSGDYTVPADSLTKWFKNNSTRITTPASEYLLNITYDSGFILFRIRGVQIHYGDDLRWEGNWNYYARKSSSSCTLPSCPSGVVLFDGHEKELNWQFSIAFAEEGKRKEVISYFDGSLRNRQSVTISNTENRTVVQESIYDALGRPAASILPAPTLDSTIHYFRGFNKNSIGDPYSFSDLLYGNCNTTAGALDTSSGTSKYYSANNSFLSSFYYAKYIPDAAGYPMAVTEYVADNTGRIKAQGGVGTTFQLGSGHETTYFYGKPTQTELDRLFGTEAGNASHYLKNMVVDPNGQVSVSYVDASGKTIATALAGITPPNLHSLASNNEGAVVNVSNDIIQPTDFNRNASDFSLTASATFLAPVPGDYLFKYRVDPLEYQKLYGPDKDSVICSDCYYDLEVIVKNACDSIMGRDTVAAGNVFDTACGSPGPIIDSFTVEVDKIGEYYVSYTLRVSRDAMLFYDSVHLEENSDIKKLNYFLLEELKNTDFYGCYSNCETCFDKLGTETEFLALFQSMYAADSIYFGTEDSLWVVSLYDSLYSNCQSIQSECNQGSICDEKLELLKMDVSPGGQYALYDSSYNLLEQSINRLDQAWRNRVAWFTDEFGNRDSVMLVNIEGEDSVLVDVKDLPDSLFIKYWKDSWADSLVKLHPEYCNYLWCISNSVSYEFDAMIENWLDADTAIARGWFDPGNYKALLDADPFFDSTGRGFPYYCYMQDSLRLFSRTKLRLAQRDKNILEFIDIMLYCNKQSNGWDDCHPDSICRSRNREWLLYKELYLNLKQRFYEAAKRASSDSVFANCVNCFIGKDLLGGGLTCIPPEISKFTTDFYSPPPAESGCNGGFIQIYYDNQQSVVSNPVKITLLVYRGCDNTDTTISIRFEKNMAGISYCPDNINHYIFMGNCETNPNKIDSVKIIGIECDTSSYTPFVDSTCNYSCPPGIYTPSDRDSMRYYIEYGNPNTPPDPPAGYGNCQFYPVFILHGGGDTACSFNNVWVCLDDSLHGVGTCPGSFTNPSSYCPDDSLAALYKNKDRRYPEYVNPDEFINGVLGNNAQQESEESLQVILDECRANCEAQADIWMNTLHRCGYSTLESIALRSALIDICSKGCSIDRPFGTSSIPASITATYHSFEEAIEAILGPGSINDSCTQELLSMPYPYDKQPVLVDRVIMETNYEICQKLRQRKQEYISSGYAGSFHSYLEQKYGAAYGLDSLELDDMLNSCTNCNGILKNDIVLPLIFDPQSGNCLRCDSISAAFTAFDDKFPGIDPLDDDYNILFTNFFNHRFGYSLTFYQYKDFLDSCEAHSGAYTGVLCNEPATQSAAGNDNSCVAGLFANALTNAAMIYIAYIDSVRKDFQDAWMTKCMNVEPRLNMKADLYEYHYTLYYYDQSGNLIRTVPPEGIALLNEEAIAAVQDIRNGTNPDCSNSNSMVFTGGSVHFPGGSVNAPQLSTGADPFTIETWINISSYDDQGILSNNHRVSGIHPYNIGYTLEIIDNKLNFLIGNSHLNYLEAESPSISNLLPLNAWTHIAVQRTGARTVKMFINGNEIPVAQSGPSGLGGVINTDHIETDPLYVGASNRNGTVSALSSGKLRHVRLYKRALPATEIRQNYMNFCGNPANREKLVFWEPFTEGEWTPDGADDSVYERIYNTAGLSDGSVDFETSNDGLVPPHRLATVYQYNSLNQVLQQYSPDGDTSVFFYDRLGRLTVSQNKEQKENASYSGSAGRFSYTLYDLLGRITLVGEKSTGTDIRTINMLKQDSVAYWLGTGTNRQLTKTIYDNPINLYQNAGASRKRVVASIYLENETDEEGDSTLYSYDINGNVKTLWQHIKALVAADNTNGKKQIDYDYDLVSGKVNTVSYQPGKGDQFFYKYSYDADNRVIRSYSSRDKLIWTEDASYTYYLHGPLARTELGQYKVQGVDYAYTLQGWLKGINSDSLSPAYDMANDGKSGALFARVSRDVYGFKLGYFNNEYIPIDITNATAFANKTYTAPGSLDNTGNELFNGNISYTTLALSKLNGGATTGYSYGYDQLNRLVEMRQHRTNAGGGWSNSNIITAYSESIAYDANGNILKYLRNGAAATPDMDSFNYKYNRNVDGNLVNNKLNHVRDAVNAANYSVDIDNQSANNYVYDLIGNLKKDVAEGIDTIRWTVYGKINKIVKGAVNINYGYDAGGNRTVKKVSGGADTLTFYVRDAQGNVLAIYSKKEEENIRWNEQHLYGSSRLGMWNWDTLVPTGPPVVDEEAIYDSLMLGRRSYELSNHLGNVLATISDKKIGNDSSDVVNYYIAEVLSQNDYYPFGMELPRRQYNATTGYRYGFNGKEKDTEGPVQYDYGFRIYDPRLGRFKSVDPLFQSYPWYTPFQFAGNNPIWKIDLDGLEEAESKSSRQSKEKAESALKVTGTEKQGQMSADKGYVFLEGGDNNKRNGLHGLWLPVPSQKSVDEGYGKVQKIIEGAKGKGGVQAAANLTHWLNGTGNDLAVPVEWLKKVGAVQDAIEVNYDRFFSEMNSNGQTLVSVGEGLKNGQSTSFSDNWVRSVNTGILPAISTNTTIDADIDFSYAIGTGIITSTGNFTITRNGDNLSIKGTIMHKFTDRYDWEFGLSVSLGDTEILDQDLKYLEVYKKAKAYNISTSWTQEVNTTVKVK